VPTRAEPIRYGTSAARGVLAATVLGSGIAFLDGTVVNVALPAIGRNLHTSIGGLQWTVDAYLVTLSALLMLGGSLGDHFGRRRIYVAGLGVFTASSLLCAVAPSAGFLIAARAVQGVGGALLVPGSLAIIAATFHPDDRARAIGAWSGLAGVASAIGPFLGGWLIDAVSWRLIFLINAPIAAVAAAVALRHVPETRAEQRAPIDMAGATAITLALAALAYTAIEHGSGGARLALAAGVIAVVAFVVREATAAHPMLPLGIFRAPAFTGANVTTFAVYGALGIGVFLVVMRLQISLGYSALEAGSALVPFTALMLVLSPTAGRVAQRVGARAPMTIGPVVTASSMLLFSSVGPGSHYASAVLPAVALFGIGMAITVAPLTAAVLGSVDPAFVGVASGVNNAVARLAGLLAVAVLPAVVGLDRHTTLAHGLAAGYASALRIAAALCVLGAGVSWALVRGGGPARISTHPAPFAACHHPASNAGAALSADVN